MSRKAQALLELALFLGLMLMVLLAALSYQRNLREQSLTDTDVFKKAKVLARDNTFLRTDIDGIQILCSGAVVSYSLNADRQANRIFQGGQRRTSASAVSIYYSNDEDPPDLEYNYYNTAANDISKGDAEKRLYLPRQGGADPEDAMKISTAEYLLVAYPALEALAKGLMNLVKGANYNDWVAKWGNWLEFARIAAAAALAIDIGIALGKIRDARSERDRLKAQDEQYGLWGWRVADETHDGKALAGKNYVKVVRPQTWDVATVEPKSINYTETQTGDNSVRNVTIGDAVTYAVYRSYDVTTQDAVSGFPIHMSGHVFEKLPSKQVTVDLGGSQSETWN